MSELATFALRHHFQHQPDLQITPIEKIQLPTRSRDELPPMLAGLQWIWTHPTLKAEIFALLEAKILAGKKATGRTGMDLWQILVLGVVRLGLDADWDRMEHIANYDLLVRQMLGVTATPWGADAKVFGHQTLRDNVALLDDPLLKEINGRIAAAGREVFATKGGALMETEPIIVGGEESGGLSVKGHVPEKDGILACLLMAELVAYERKSLGQILKTIAKQTGEFHTEWINIKIPLEKKDALLARLGAGLDAIGPFKVEKFTTTDGYKFLLPNREWVAFRASGTEPVFRCYIEAKSAAQLKRLRQQCQRLLAA